MERFKNRAFCSNPIEKAFSKLKTLLRKAKARTIETLWEEVGNI